MQGSDLPYLEPQSRPALVCKQTALLFCSRGNICSLQKANICHPGLFGSRLSVLNFIISFTSGFWSLQKPHSKCTQVLASEKSKNPEALDSKCYMSVTWVVLREYEALWFELNIHVTEFPTDNIIFFLHCWFTRIYIVIYGTAFVA